MIALTDIDIGLPILNHLIQQQPNAALDPSGCTSMIGGNVPKIGGPLSKLKTFKELLILQLRPSLSGMCGNRRTSLRYC